MKEIVDEMKTQAIEAAMEMAEKQAATIQSGIIGYVQSDEFEDKLADFMDEAINIPFVKGQKENDIFHDVADVVQKILANVMSNVIKLKS
jgi:hypothetical protein